jgi:putative MATE family efflux protein
MNQSIDDQTNKMIPDKNQNKRLAKMAELWQDIVESVKGSQRNYTEGSIGKAILLLSIPMVLELVMESIFAVADIFFVSKLGSDAVATVGTTESIMTIVYAIGIGLSMSATAIVARRTGEKKPEGAAIAAVQAIWVSILAALPIALLGFFYSKELLSLMGMSDAIIDEGYLYTAIMLSGNVVIMLIFIINAIFRGVGDAAVAMRVLWIANLINLILDPCLIFGWGPFPELGIMGAAVATNIGRGVGVIIQIYYLQRKSGSIQILKKHLKIQWATMKNLIRVSLGGIGQFIIATSSWVVLVRIMNEFGSEAVAGYTIAIRIVIFSILPSWGMSNAAATLVGQNLGAKKPDRAEKSVWYCSFANMIFLAMIAIIFILYSEFLVSLFTQEQNVIAIGAECLRYLSYGYIFYGYGMIMIQAFNGAGDTMTPTIINFFCFWLFEIPFALWASFSLGMDERGVFLSVLLAESLIGVVGIIMFKRGKWKTREV